ncbi:MAG: hypothetical protein ACRDIE_16765, partial [Chloroflexota bacterium]
MIGQSSTAPDQIAHEAITSTGKASTNERALDSRARGALGQTDEDRSFLPLLHALLDQSPGADDA